jgi:DNA-binding transcriptional LysR family regulator
MEMHQVRYFLALANTLNFTKAADECNVTQPALTRAIKQLEEEFGGDLIRRERSQSHLTELGRRMLPLLRQCHDAALSAKTLARAVKDNELAPLSMAICNSINIELAMPSIAELFRAYPGIQLRLIRGSASSVAEALKGGGVELAVAGDLATHWDRLDRWPLFSEPIEVVVSREHRLARDGIDEVSPEALSSEPVVHRLACEFAEELSSRLAAFGVAPETVHEVETDQDLMALLEAGGGIGFVAASATRSPATRRIRLNDPALSRTVCIYGVAGRERSSAAATLLSLLRSADWPAREISARA